MGKVIRILVVDDHAIFRLGLRDILEKHLPGVVVGEAETGQDAVAQVRKARWNIVILDVTMPGRNGVDILEDIKRTRPDLPVLILSMHTEEQYGVRVLKAGAAGYITKIKAPLAIVDAVKTVLAGDRYISPALAERLVAQPVHEMYRLPHDRLSRREYQVMCMIPTGKSLKAIAGELAVTIQTVSTLRSRILKKMGLLSTADLIRYTLEHGLVD